MAGVGGTCARTPMRQTFGCCARAVSGHAAVPASNVMNWRRRMPGALQPRATGSVYRRLSLLQSGLQVLGVDLNCSEIGGLMSALGQKRTSSGHLGQIRFTPKADIRRQA